jgi:hypothetical protein
MPTGAATAFWPNICNKGAVLKISPALPRRGMRQAAVSLLTPPLSSFVQSQIVNFVNHSTSIPSAPLPRRLRRRTPTHAPLIPSPGPQPLLRRQLQLSVQLRTRLFPMYEVAEPASDAAFAAVEPTARFAEIRHGRELAVDGARGIPARVERVAGLLGGVFVLEACVDVAD